MGLAVVGSACCGPWSTVTDGDVISGGPLEDCGAELDGWPAELDTGGWDVAVPEEGKDVEDPPVAEDDDGPDGAEAEELPREEDWLEEEVRDPLEVERLVPAPEEVVPPEDAALEVLLPDEELEVESSVPVVLHRTVVNATRHVRKTGFTAWRMGMGPLLRGWLTCAHPGVTGRAGGPGAQNFRNAGVGARAGVRARVGAGPGWCGCAP